MLKKIINHNIFNDNITDALFYIICYILVPVSISGFGLLNAIQNNDLVDTIYLYFSIFINALNILYDTYSRFTNAEEPFLRGLLIINAIPAAIISIYCFIVFCSMLIVKNMNFRCDQIFLVYVLSASIVVFNFVVCLMKSIALKKQI